MSDEADGDVAVRSADQAGTSGFDFGGVQNNRDRAAASTARSLPPTVAGEVAFFDVKNDPPTPIGVESG